jgi:hypothetical protein
VCAGEVLLRESSFAWLEQPRGSTLGSELLRRWRACTHLTPAEHAARVRALAPHASDSCALWAGAPLLDFAMPALRLNGFQCTPSGGGGGEVQALFLVASLSNHSCAPNVAYSCAWARCDRAGGADDDGGEVVPVITLTALRDARPGDELLDVGVIGLGALRRACARPGARRRFKRTRREPRSHAKKG